MGQKGAYPRGDHRFNDASGSAAHQDKASCRSRRPNGKFVNSPLEARARQFQASGERVKSMARAPRTAWPMTGGAGIRMVNL